MPREIAESAAKYPAPDGGDTGLRGSESDQTAADDESSDDQHEDFVLSEETLSQLPPKERAIAAAALRAQRENAELRAALAKRQDDDDYEYEDDDEPKEPEEPEILKEIPVEGYEKLAPILKEVLGGLIQENKKLHERLDRMEEGSTKASRISEFKTFKRLHPDWQKYDESMARIAKNFGFVPSSVEQLEELYDLAKAKTEKPSLEAEIERSRKAGPNPKLGTPAPSLRGRLPGVRNGRRPGNIRDAFNKAWEESMRENPV